MKKIKTYVWKRGGQEVENESTYGLQAYLTYVIEAHIRSARYIRAIWRIK
jgi:hypothetical protein